MHGGPGYAVSEVTVLGTLSNTGHNVGPFLGTVGAVSGGKVSTGPKHI